MKPFTIRPQGPATAADSRVATTARWRPQDIVTLIAVTCYGAAVLLVAAGLFVRLASHL